MACDRVLTVFYDRMFDIGSTSKCVVQAILWGLASDRSLQLPITDLAQTWEQVHSAYQVRSLSPKKNASSPTVISDQSSTQLSSIVQMVFSSFRVNKREGSLLLDRSFFLSLFLSREKMNIMQRDGQQNFAFWQLRRPAAPFRFPFKVESYRMVPK